MSDSDLQLLERYTRQHAEDAFAEIVRRHLDLVFSAALRQVHSPQLAEEVAQSAFTDLARQADRLAPDTVLSAWLYQVTRRTAIDVVRREARRQAREQVAQELNAMNTTTADWTHIEPLLDEAMQALEATDRTAVLLRYFENKSLRDVGQTLGTTEEAARKRVSRAVERLRELLAKQGVAIGASGLVLLISANAVQAAPGGLAVTISTAAALAGATLTTTATATATKAIVMTTLQKTLIATALVAAVGTGVYEAHQASRLRDENQALQQQQAPLNEQIQQLQRERDAAKTGLAAAQAQLAKSKPGSNTGELLRLRGEVGTLRQRVASGEPKAGGPSNGASKWMSDPHMAEYMRQAAADKVKSLYAPLFQELKLTPEQKEKFGQLFGDQAMNFFSKLSTASQGTPEQSGAAPSAAAAGSDLAGQLRSLLGDAGYARYQEFSEEIPGRAAVGLLNTQLDSNPLSDEQSARLTQIVKA
jgi:RNA polymerase sigma factor (sigma-70 family)